MDLEERTVKMQVIGKRERIKGWIFKRPEYLVALQIVDETATTHPTLQHEFSYHQYAAITTGDIIDITIYSKNGQNWYLSKGEAELFGE
ncbi:MAG: hypothetical protein WC916_07785 [Candidatus Woesearchaeota archaeon]